MILFTLTFRRSCSHPTSKFSTCDSSTSAVVGGQRSKGLIQISFGACPFQLGGSTGSTTRNFTWKCLGDWSAHNPGERYLALLDTTNDLQDLSTPHRRYRCAVSLFFYLLHIYIVTSSILVQICDILGSKINLILWLWSPFWSFTVNSGISFCKLTLLQVTY